MNNNDVVIVELDRKRELRFGHKALKRIGASSGKSMEELEGDDLEFEQIEEIFFYGLQKDAKANGETLTMEMMEDILDYADSYEYLLSKMAEAMQKAMGKFAGNLNPAVNPPAQRARNRSTGKNR